MQKFINWVGCKKKLLPKILPLIPKKFKTYHEPFLGSGALYLALMPKKAILNDNDPALILIWKSVLNHPQAFFQATLKAENHIYQYSEQKAQKQTFYQLLAQYNHSITKKIKKAALFFVLHKYCFRGITKYSVNQAELKVSFSYKPKLKTSLLNLEDLITFQKHFRKNKHVLFCDDYQKIITKATKGDFLFIDPPYYNGENIKITAFYKTPFGFEDQVVLYHCLEKADQRGAKWLYTNFDTPAIRTLFQNYHFQSVKSSTTQNLTNKNNKHEIIITNYQH